MGTRWRDVARRIRERDSGACRHCGASVGLGAGPIDHLIPRRLFRNGEDPNFPENLALLCTRCHAVKTHTIEPGLYEGKYQDRYRRFLEIVGRSGPIPGFYQLAIALGRVAEALR